MYSRWYSVAVVLLWIATMSWLIIRKVVPTMLVGSPPSYRDILESHPRNVIDCWSIDWDGRGLGWAASQRVQLPQEMTEIRSRVHFNRIPLPKKTPAWLRTMFGSRNEHEDLAVEVDSRLEFDPLSRLSQFESFLGLSGSDELIKLRGQIVDGLLSVRVHVGGITHETEMLLPEKALVGDALAPQSHLPELREGQSWTVEIYSPLRRPDSPVELLQATVEGLQPVFFNGRPVDAWLVVYRSDPGASVSQAKRVRGRMWVHASGTVLRQQVEVLGSRLTFTRMSEAEADRLIREKRPWLKKEGFEELTADDR